MSPCFPLIHRTQRTKPICGCPFSAVSVLFCTLCSRVSPFGVRCFMGVSPFGALFEVTCLWVSPFGGHPFNGCPFSARSAHSLVNL